MTAILYPDCSSSSPDGRLVLEARSPHNGTIPHRNGQPATEDEFGFKYRQHQSEFRYRLLDNDRIVWERWQERREDSPHELVVSDAGWGMIRTHGFWPEVIAVSPEGQDVVRVWVTGAGEHGNNPSSLTPVFSWAPDRLQHSTAGLYWSGHSWPYFLCSGGSPFFVWRAFWGQRMVVDLGRAALVSEEQQTEEALAEAEKQGVYEYLAKLSPRMEEVRQLLSRRGEDGETEPPPLMVTLRRVTAALHLVGIHRLKSCTAFLREWETIDRQSRPAHTRWRTGGGWRRNSFGQSPRTPCGCLTNSLRVSRPTTSRTSEITRGAAFRAPERVPNRREKSAAVTMQMKAPDVLGLLGPPDFVKKRPHEMGRSRYRWTEEWEYDLRLPDGSETLRFTWEDGRILSVEKVAPYWLQTRDREYEILSL